MADLLDFFDFFLIGYVTAALTKEWSLTYWQGGAILLASGLGAVPGAFVWGWLGDKIGRRTVFIWSAVTISLATGIMAFTPGPDALGAGLAVPDVFPVLCRHRQCRHLRDRHAAGAGIHAGHKRGWVSALITTLLPGGSMLAGIVAAWLLPIIGWRYLFLIGLSPIVLVLMIRYWVPESPRWLMRMGRHRGGAPVARLGADGRPEGDRPADRRAGGRDDALGRIVQVSAAGHRRLPDRPDADRRRLARAVGRDIARDRAQHLAGACGLPDDLRQPCGDSRPVQHHRTDRAARPPRRGNAVLRNGGGADRCRRLLLRRRSSAAGRSTTC